MSPPTQRNNVKGFKYNRLTLEDEQQIWVDLAPMNTDILMEELARGATHLELRDILEAWVRSTWTTNDGKDFIPFDKGAFTVSLLS